MTKTLKNKKGTSLVELLAVIVIMGIIAAIAIPAVGSLITAQQTNANVESANVVLGAANTQLLVLQGSQRGQTSWTITSTQLVEGGFVNDDPFENVVTFTLNQNDSQVGVTTDGDAVIQVGGTVLAYDSTGEDATFKFIVAPAAP